MTVYHVRLHLGAPVNEDVTVAGIIADTEHEAVAAAVSEVAGSIEFRSIREDHGPENGQS